MPNPAYEPEPTTPGWADDPPTVVWSAEYLAALATPAADKPTAEPDDTAEPAEEPVEAAGDAAEDIVGDNADPAADGVDTADEVSIDAEGAADSAAEDDPEGVGDEPLTAVLPVVTDEPDTDPEPGIADIPGSGDAPTADDATDTEPADIPATAEEAGSADREPDPGDEPADMVFTGELSPVDGGGTSRRRRPVWPWLAAAVLAVLFALSAAFRGAHSVASPDQNTPNASTPSHPGTSDGTGPAFDATSAQHSTAALIVAPPGIGAATRSGVPGATTSSTSTTTHRTTSRPTVPPTTTATLQSGPTGGPTTTVNQPGGHQPGDPCPTPGAAALSPSGQLMICKASSDGTGRWAVV